MKTSLPLSYIRTRCRTEGRPNEIVARKMCFERRLQSPYKAERSKKVCWISYFLYFTPNCCISAMPCVSTSPDISTSRRHFQHPVCVEPPIVLCHWLAAIYGGPYMFVQRQNSDKGSIGGPITLAPGMLRCTKSLNI